MRFVTSCFGLGHVSFLAVALRSLADSHPATGVEVLHDLPADVVAKLARLNPRAMFVYSEVNADREAQADRRIARKLDHWLEALDRAPANETLLLIDCDTIVRRPLDEYLPDEFDLIVTHKPEPARINTGVVAVRASPRAAAFFRLWRDETQHIAASRERFDEAMKESGALDQHSLLSLLGALDRSTPLDGRRDLAFAFGPIVVVGLACAVLNQTNSVPLASEARILHYKGRWHPVLLRGKHFTHRRTYRASHEMYDLWLRSLRTCEAVTGLALLPASVWRRHYIRQAIGKVTIGVRSLGRKALAHPGSSLGQQG